MSTTKAIIITLIIALLLSFAYILPAQGEENTDITIYTEDVDQNGVLLNWFMLLSDIPSTDTASVRENYGIPDTVSDALLFSFQAYITNHTSTTQHIAILGIPYLYTVDEQGNKHIWRFFGEYDSLATADTVPEVILNKASLGSLAYGQGRIFWEYYIPAGETKKLIFLGWNKEMDDIYKQALAAVGGDRKKVNIGAYIYVWPWKGDPTSGDLYHYNDYIAFYNLTSLMFYYDYQPEPPNNWPNTGTCDENFVYWKKEGDKYILAGHIADIADNTFAYSHGVGILHQGDNYYLYIPERKYLQQISPDEGGFFTAPDIYTYQLTGEYTRICGYDNALALTESTDIHWLVVLRNAVARRLYSGGESQLDISAKTGGEYAWILTGVNYNDYSSYSGAWYDLYGNFVYSLTYGVDQGAGWEYAGSTPQQALSVNCGKDWVFGSVLYTHKLYFVATTDVPPLVVYNVSSFFLTTEPYAGAGQYKFVWDTRRFVYACADQYEITGDIVGVHPVVRQIVQFATFAEFLAPIYNSSLPSLTASTDLLGTIFSCKQPTGDYSGWFGWAQWIGDWFVYLVCLLWSLIKGIVFVIAAFLGFLVVIVGAVLMLIFYLLQMFAGIVTQIGQAFQEMQYPWNIVLAEMLLLGMYGIVIYTYDMIPILNRR